MDTNQINQMGENIQAVRDQVQLNWPAICAAVIWIRAELKSLNAWAKAVAEWVIGHGGVGWILCKLIWNRPTGQKLADKAVCAPIATDALPATPESKISS